MERDLTELEELISEQMTKDAIAETLALIEVQRAIAESQTATIH